MNADDGQPAGSAVSRLLKMGANQAILGGAGEKACNSETTYLLYKSLVTVTLDFARLHFGTEG